MVRKGGAVKKATSVQKTAMKKGKTGKRGGRIVVVGTQRSVKRKSAARTSGVQKAGKAKFHKRNLTKTVVAKPSRRVSNAPNRIHHVKKKQVQRKQRSSAVSPQKRKPASIKKRERKGVVRKSGGAKTRNKKTITSMKKKVVATNAKKKSVLETYPATGAQEILPFNLLTVGMSQDVVLGSGKSSSSSTSDNSISERSIRVVLGSEKKLPKEKMPKERALTEVLIEDTDNISVRRELPPGVARKKGTARKGVTTWSEACLASAVVYYYRAADFPQNLLTGDFQLQSAERVIRVKQYLACDYAPNSVNYAALTPDWGRTDGAFTLEAHRNGGFHGLDYARKPCAIATVAGTTAEARWVGPANRKAEEVKQLLVAVLEKLKPVWPLRPVHSAGQAFVDNVNEITGHPHLSQVVHACQSEQTGGRDKGEAGSRNKLGATKKSGNGLQLLTANSALPGVLNSVSGSAAGKKMCDINNAAPYGAMTYACGTYWARYPKAAHSFRGPTSMFDIRWNTGIKGITPNWRAGHEAPNAGELFRAPRMIQALAPPETGKDLSRGSQVNSAISYLNASGKRPAARDRPYYLDAVGVFRGQYLSASGGPKKAKTGEDPGVKETMALYFDELRNTYILVRQFRLKLSQLKATMKKGLFTIVRGFPRMARVDFSQGSAVHINVGHGVSSGNALPAKSADGSYQDVLLMSAHLDNGPWEALWIGEPDVQKPKNAPKSASTALVTLVQASPRNGDLQQVRFLGIVTEVLANMRHQDR